MDKGKNNCDLEGDECIIYDLEWVFFDTRPLNGDTPSYVNGIVNS